MAFRLEEIEKRLSYFGARHLYKTEKEVSQKRGWLKGEKGVGREWNSKREPTCRWAVALIRIDEMARSTALRYSAVSDLGQ